MSQFMVIGLDGATFDIIHPLIEAGRLPNLARLKVEGAWGNLRSVMHPESPQAWSSFLTGVNPGKHGVFGFTRQIAGSYDRQVNTSNTRAGPDIAEILAQQGKRVGLFNVPLTYPPHPTNGFVVSGMGTPGLDSDFVYPPELKKELLQAFGRDVWVEPKILDKTPLEYLDALHRSIDRTLGISEFLLQRFAALDFYVLVFMASDRVQHFYWHYSDHQHPDYVADAPQELKYAINGIYEHLDRAVGQLLIGREDWNVVVMSDHGGGPFYRTVNLNRWLEKEGYLRFLNGSSATNGRQTDKFQYLKTAYRFYCQRIAPGLSHHPREALRKLVPQVVIDRLQGYRHNPTLSKIDWSQTQAYAEGSYGRIFLNIAGREPGGIVSFEEREQLLTKIGAKLLALKDPLSHERVIDRVYRSEELFEGPFVDEAPDLLIEWRNWQHHTRDSFVDRGVVFSPPDYWQFSKLRHTANHRLHGILLMRGEAIQEGKELTGAEIIDLAPTFLYLIGAKIPETMDGKVLLQAINPEVRRRYQPGNYSMSSNERERPSAGENYTEEEAEIVKQQLRELGYID